MIDPPRILQTPRQLTAVIRLTIPRSEIRRVIGPALKELRATLASQGIVPVGPWFTRHLRMQPDTYDFEIGLPVAKPVVAAGRVTSGKLPASMVARTTLHGSYEGLAAAWPQLDAWIVTQGRKPGPSLWEAYLTDPAENTDAATWLTELQHAARRRHARACSPPIASAGRPPAVAATTWFAIRYDSN
jgi:effector-binding domain-containing protein